MKSQKPEHTSAMVSCPEEYHNVINKLKKVLIKKQTLRKKQLCPISQTNLFIGNYSHAININLLQKDNIQLVISCVQIDPREVEAGFFAGITYHVMPFKDHKQVDVIEQIEKATQIINSQENKNKKILVNCFSGRSRSVALVIGYLMKEWEVGYEECSKRVGESYDTSGMNSGFEDQLKNLGDRIQEKRKNYSQLISNQDQEQGKHDPVQMPQRQQNQSQPEIADHLKVDEKVKSSSNSEDNGFQVLKDEELQGSNKQNRQDRQSQEEGQKKQQEIVDQQQTKKEESPEQFDKLKSKNDVQEIIQKQYQKEQEQTQQDEPPQKIATKNLSEQQSEAAQTQQGQDKEQSQKPKKKKNKKNKKKK